MWADTRRALRRVVRLRGVTLALLATVRAPLSVLTGARYLVAVVSERRLDDATVGRREERIPAVVVRDVGPPLPDPVVKDETNLVRDGDDPLSFPLILERCVGIGSVSKPQRLLFRVVVFDVERSHGAHPEHRVPQERRGHVADRGVLVPFEVREDFLRVFGLKHHVTTVLPRRDVRRADLLVEVLLDSVD